MKSFAAICIATIATACAIPAHANSPLYQATCEYRNAVRDFEDTVRDMRCTHDLERRLVDQLEDSTSKLRSYSKRTDRFDRFMCAWSETKALHTRVQYSVAIPYADHPELIQRWERVRCAYDKVRSEVACIVRGQHTIAPYGTNEFGPAPPVIRAPHLEPPRVESPYLPGPSIEPPRVLAPPSPRIQTSFNHGRFDDFDHFDRSRNHYDHGRSDEPVYSRHMMRASDMRSAMIGAMLSRFAR